MAEQHHNRIRPTIKTVHPLTSRVHGVGGVAATSATLAVRLVQIIYYVVRMSSHGC